MSNILTIWEKMRTLLPLSLSLVSSLSSSTNFPLPFTRLCGLQSQDVNISLQNKKKNKKTCTTAFQVVLFILQSKLVAMTHRFSLRCCSELKRAHKETYLQVLLLCFSVSLFWLFNEETMVTALFQLHNNVQEARGAASGAFGESFVIPC